MRHAPLIQDDAHIEVLNARDQKQTPEVSFHHQSMSPEDLWNRIRNEVDHVQTLLGVSVSDQFCDVSLVNSSRPCFGWGSIHWRWSFSCIIVGTETPWSNGLWTLLRRSIRPLASLLRNRMDRHRAATIPANERGYHSHPISSVLCVVVMVWTNQRRRSWGVDIDSVRNVGRNISSAKWKARQRANSNAWKNPVQRLSMNHS